MIIQPNHKDALPFCTTLEEIGHPQPPTPMQVDNTIELGLQRIKKIRIGQRRLTCASTGSGIAPARDTSRFTGTLEAPTLGTTTANTILGHHHLMSPNFLHNETHVHLATLPSCIFCEGVNSCRMRAV